LIIEMHKNIQLYFKIKSFLAEINNISKFYHR